MGCGASGPVEDTRKLYNFRVRLIGGLNLYNNGFGVQLPGTKTAAGRFDGASDPYCVLECSGVKIPLRSKTVLHDCNPSWNEEFYFRTDTRTPTLKITVRDEEAVGGDTQIGVATLNLHGLISKTAEREIWLPLDGAKAKGEIGIAVVEAYRVTFNIIQGIDVQPMDSLSGSSDCYLSVNVGQQERLNTDVKSWTLNPRWNEKFKFFVPYAVPSTGELILWDRDRVGVNSNMGWYYHKFDGKPKAAAAAKPGAPAAPVAPLEVKIANAKGTLQYSIEEDTACEVPEAPAVTEAQKAAFPPKAPQTVNFEVRVLGAYNLAAADGCFIDDLINDAKCDVYHEYKESRATSDPFARLDCDGQVYDTAHINNTLEPVWNEKFRFVARNRDTATIKVQLWDHDIVVNDCIGSVVLPLKMLKPGQRQEIWSFLDKGRGEVGLELIQAATLKVQIIGAEGLPAKDLNGMCDPYVKVICAGREVQTRVCRDSRNPAFEEDFRFTLHTVKNVKMLFQVWDSDLMIFKKGLSEDIIGSVEVDLDKVTPGLPTFMALPLILGGKQQGTLNVRITNEVPLPQAVWEDFAKRGQAAFDEAAAKLNSVADFIKTISPADFLSKKEAVVEPAEPKFAPRPRFSRISVDVVALRGLPGATVPLYVGVCVPAQGHRYKTKEYREGKNVDIKESFQFGVPTKLTGALEVCVFESNKHPYPVGWSDTNYGRALLKFREANDGDGLIRGSEANDEWLPLSSGGNAIVRITEMFRFQVRIVGGKGILSKSSPYVVVDLDTTTRRTQALPNDPKKDRSTGIPGEPTWEEQFTIFANKKGKVQFRLMDDTAGPDTLLGTGSFDLNTLKRGIPQDFVVQLDKNAGVLNCVFLEEEKMTLLDRMLDEAGNAAKLAAALADKVADEAKAAAASAAAAASGAASAVTGALGGLFGR